MLRWVSNLKIRWKILIAPAFLASALMGLGLYALQIQKANQAAVDGVTTGVALQADLAGDFETAIWESGGQPPASIICRLRPPMRPMPRRSRRSARTSPPR